MGGAGAVSQQGCQVELALPWGASLSPQTGIKYPQKVPFDRDNRTGFSVFLEYLRRILSDVP